MEKFFIKYPAFLTWLYPKRLSRLNSPKTLYLTFDDGPVPEVTPWVLKVLKQYNARASFFCIGENIKKYPTIFRQILKEGHQIGNHSFHHPNGWKTPTKDYIEDTLLAGREIAAALQDVPLQEPGNKLFRPPFGKIRNSQARQLKKHGYKIVMWDVISWDFDEALNEEDCFRNVVKNTREGSLVVFHDSKKASKNLKVVLPKVLEYYRQKGFCFKHIP